MDKTTKNKDAAAKEVSLTRSAFLNIALLVLAVIAIVSGVFLSFGPEWAKRSDVKLYDQGVSAYLLPAGILPATADRPSESTIVRAAAYFQKAAQQSTDNKLKALAFYNLGTMMAKDTLATPSGSTPLFSLTDAVNRLSEAVSANPDDENAKYNLELLERLASESKQDTWLSDLLLAAQTPAPGFWLGSNDRGF